jgi:hypothetical protein
MATDEPERAVAAHLGADGPHHLGQHVQQLPGRSSGDSDILIAFDNYYTWQG